MITTLNDGVSYKGALSLQIHDDGEVQFVSKGLPQNDDWVSGEELMAEGQAGLQGVFAKE